MKTTTSTSTTWLSAPTLLVDYSRWMDFVLASRRTIREYDRQLAQLGNQYAALSDLSNYLRACMHQRSQFFGDLAIQLTGKVAQLRAEPTNETLIRQLNRAHPVMQTLITQLMDAFADMEESYRVFRHHPKRLPQTPVPNRQTYHA